MSSIWWLLYCSKKVVLFEYGFYQNIISCKQLRATINALLPIALHIHLMIFERTLFGTVFLLCIVLLKVVGNFSIVIFTLLNLHFCFVWYAKHFYITIVNTAFYILVLYTIHFHLPIYALKVF